MMCSLLAMMCLILLGLLCLSVYFNIKHAKIIIATEDAIEQTLDVCDVAYGKMSEVLDMPVAINTPEVKHIVTQMLNVRDSVLYVSNILAAPYGGVVEITEE